MKKSKNRRMNSSVRGPSQSIPPEAESEGQGMGLELRKKFNEEASVQVRVPMGRRRGRGVELGRARSALNL